MTSILFRRFVSLALLGALVAPTVTPQQAPQQAPQAEVTSVVVALNDLSQPSDVVGQGGLLNKAACVGCAGAILMATGGTIAGLIVASFIWPQTLAACAAVCYVAFAT